VSAAKIACAVTAAALVLGGCVERTISITTEPPGALVWLNDREVGRAPLEVRFIHYGTYDVRLELEGCEPQMTSGRAAPPWWDAPGPDLLAELVPGRRAVRIAWHYQLQPLDDDPEALLERAADLRRTTAPAGDGGGGEPPQPP
jgi:hypothetical protein